MIRVREAQAYVDVSSKYSLLYWLICNVGEQNMKVNYDRDEAAQLFVQQLYKELVDGFGSEIVNSLASQSPGDPTWQRLSNWYSSLKDTDKTAAHDLVCLVLKMSAFCICAMLDGISGYSSPPIDAEADFALYLQTYPDFDSLLAGEPIMSSVRINPDAGGEGPMLIDLIKEKIGWVIDSDEIGSSNKD